MNQYITVTPQSTTNTFIASICLAMYGKENERTRTKLGKTLGMKRPGFIQDLTAIGQAVSQYFNVNVTIYTENNILEISNGHRYTVYLIRDNDKKFSLLVHRMNQEPFKDKSDDIFELRHCRVEDSECNVVAVLNKPQSPEYSVHTCMFTKKGNSSELYVVFPRDHYKFTQPTYIYICTDYDKNYEWIGYADGGTKQNPYFYIDSDDDTCCYLCLVTGVGSEKEAEHATEMEVNIVMKRKRIKKIHINKHTL